MLERYPFTAGSESAGGGQHWETALQRPIEPDPDKELAGFTTYLRGLQEVSPTDLYKERIRDLATDPSLWEALGTRNVRQQVKTIYDAVEELRTQYVNIEKQRENIRSGGQFQNLIQLTVLMTMSNPETARQILPIVVGARPFLENAWESNLTQKQMIVSDAITRLLSQASNIERYAEAQRIQILSPLLRFAGTFTQKEYDMAEKLMRRGFEAIRLKYRLEQDRVKAARDAQYDFERIALKTIGELDKYEPGSPMRVQMMRRLSRMSQELREQLGEHGIYIVPLDDDTAMEIAGSPSAKYRYLLSNIRRLDARTVADYAVSELYKANTIKTLSDAGLNVGKFVMDTLDALQATLTQLNGTSDANQIVSIIALAAEHMINAEDIARTLFSKGPPVGDQRTLEQNMAKKIAERAYAVVHLGLNIMKSATNTLTRQGGELTTQGKIIEGVRTNLQTNPNLQNLINPERKNVLIEQIRALIGP